MARNRSCSAKAAPSRSSHRSSPPLRADSLLIGFGPPDASTHALNESLDLEVFAKAIAASRRLLVKLKRG